MEDILTQFLNSGPVGIVSAAVVYLIIALQRNSTKKSRDENQDKLETRITLLEHDCEFMKQQHALFGQKLDKILEELTNIKVELAHKEEKK
jgi:uncharacterized protein YoxC